MTGMNSRNATNKTRSNSTAFALVLTLLLAFTLVGCKPENVDLAAAEDYRHLVRAVMVAEQSEFRIEREFAGLVVPRQSTDIGFEQAGQVARILIDDGAQVVAGQLLAELDVQLLEAERDELIGRRSDIESRVILNQANMKRALELQHKGFAADQRIDELVAEQGTLEASMAQIDAGLRATDTRVEKSKLIAPFAGSVSRRYVDEGAVLGSGTPVFRMLEDSSLEARVGVPVRLLNHISAGQSVGLVIAGEPVTGQVLAIGTDVTRATLTVPARIGIPADSHVVSGAQAYLRLNESVQDKGFWLPLTSLTEGLRGLWNVYVLVPGDDADLYRIESRDVQISYANQRDAFVSGALADGEKVVASGLHRLVPGQWVRVETKSLAAR
jgi:RND family efflux transporter MFP subunit